MNKPLSLAAALLTSLALGTAFAQSVPDQLSNEVAAGAATAPVTTSTTRDEVTHSMLMSRQHSPDSMSNETAAGATSERAGSSLTRDQVQGEVHRAQQQPHNAMDTERAAWG